jgi:REP element-mobilizing transposase RayT
MNYKYHKQYRLPNFDYSGEGEYFVTVCTADRKHHFGEVKDDIMFLSDVGKIADKTWNEIPAHFENIKLDIYQFMPDHFHGILKFKPCRNLIHQIPDKENQKFKSGIKNNPMELSSITLGRIMRWFKGRVKYEASKFQYEFDWQSRFHDRVIRDDKEFYFISEYIINNPKNWGEKILEKYLNEHRGFHKLN